MDKPDISNRTLGIEIIFAVGVPFLILAFGGLVSYGSLSADVDHKADRADVEVLKVEVEHIKETTEDIKAEQKEQRSILEQIARDVAEGD